MFCSEPNPIFGNQIPEDVRWTVQRSPDDLNVYGVIGSINDNNEIIPNNIVGCEIEIPVYNPATGALIYTFSSAGMNPAIAIIPGVVDPNFHIFMLNADFVALFTELGTYPCSFIFTNSLGVVTTYWKGFLVIQ